MTIVVDLLSRTEAGAPITSGQYDTTIASIEASFALAATDASITISQYDILGRIAAGSGLPTGLTLGDLTEEATPADGDFLLGWLATGELRVFDIANLPGGVGGSGHTIKEEGGAALTQRTSLNFVGPTITATDDAGNDATVITVVAELPADPVEDAGNYSVTPFAVTSTPNFHRFFTGAQNHIIEFPAGLTATPAAHGKFTAPAANTLTLRRVAGSGVSINGVASDGFTWVVPATGTVDWVVRASNTIELRFDNLFAQTIPNVTTFEAAATFEALATFEEEVVLASSASGGGLINVTRSGTAITVADSSKYIITSGAVTIPNTAIGDGWFHCQLEIGANTHDLTFNSLVLDISVEGFVAGEVYSVVVKSASTIKVVGPAGTFNQTDFA